MRFHYIREWDGSLARVTVIGHCTDDTLDLLYLDGTRHTVSNAYHASVFVCAFDPNVF